jgi:two-component system NarL family sensor kinase
MAPLQEGNITVIFILGTLAMLVLVMGIILLIFIVQRRASKHAFEKRKIELNNQKKLMQAILATEEKERAHIASDLHDNIGATLATIKLRLSTLTYLPENEKEESIQGSKLALDNAIDSVRKISHNLLPPSLERFGIDKALEELTEDISTAGLPYTLTGKFGEINNDTALAIYRCIQELVNNSIKHAEAKALHLKLFRDSESVTITHSDNGKGFTNSKELKFGLGLQNIDGRLKAIDGVLSIDSEIGKGSSFKIIIKL